jgi:hypothetical protein
VRTESFSASWNLCHKESIVLEDLREHAFLKNTGNSSISGT